MLETDERKTLTMGGLEGLRNDINEVRLIATGCVNRTIDVASSMNNLRDTVQGMATNMATLTQTLLGNEQNRKLEMDYVKDYLDIVKSSQSRIQTLELWKARQEGSIKTGLSMILSGASLVAFIATIVMWLIKH